MKNKNIHELRLHESVTIQIDYHLEARITRVPGGWLYQYIEYKTTAIRQTDVTSTQPPVFVPYVGSADV